MCKHEFILASYSVEKIFYPWIAINQIKTDSTQDSSPLTFPFFCSIAAVTSFFVANYHLFRFDTGFRGQYSQALIKIDPIS